MLIDADDSQLILIDYQPRLMSALADAALAQANALRLAQAAQMMGVPAWGTAQAPDRLGDLDPALAALCQKVLSKNEFSAAAVLSACLTPPQHTGGNARSLPKHLQRPSAAPRRSQLVLAGCEAHVCLLQTALTLLEDEESEVWVVTDACTSRTERNRDAAFDRLASAGAELVTTEMVLFEWLRGAHHPQFKAIQALIK